MCGWSEVKGGMLEICSSVSNQKTNYPDGQGSESEGQLEAGLLAINIFDTIVFSFHSNLLYLRHGSLDHYF